MDEYIVRLSKNNRKVCSWNNRSIDILYYNSCFIKKLAV